MAATAVSAQRAPLVRRLEGHVRRSDLLFGAGDALLQAGSLTGSGGRSVSPKGGHDAQSERDLLAAGRPDGSR